MENQLSEFETILKEVKENQRSLKTKPQVAMEHFGVSRRGWRIAEAINKLLNRYEVISEPEIGTCWVYSEVVIKPKPKVSMGKSVNANEYDPTPRLSMLSAANIVQSKKDGRGIGLLVTTPTEDLKSAITKMMLHDFSQLPVMNGEREVKGMISWKSIGKAYSLGTKCEKVSDCMTDVVVMEYNEPLFRAVKTILEREVVLVRQQDKTISGIVTVTDIGGQFIALAEPFLVLEQIENHLRKLLDGKFTTEELRKFVDPSDGERKIESLADLTFGEYVNIVGNQNAFDKLSLSIDKTVLAAQLDIVRKIRNDVMHFDPEHISNEELQTLHNTAEFFQSINQLKK